MASLIASIPCVTLPKLGGHGPHMTWVWCNPIAGIAQPHFNMQNLESVMLQAAWHKPKYLWPMGLREKDTVIKVGIFQLHLGMKTEVQ